MAASENSGQIFFNWTSCSVIFHLPPRMCGLCGERRKEQYVRVCSITCNRDASSLSIDAQKPFCLLPPQILRYIHQHSLIQMNQGPVRLHADSGVCMSIESRNHLLRREHLTTVDDVSRV